MCESKGFSIRTEHHYLIEVEHNRNRLEININKMDSTTAQETIRNLEIEDGQEIKRTDKKYLGFIISRMEWDRSEILTNN